MGALSRVSEVCSLRGMGWGQLHRKQTYTHVHSTFCVPRGESLGSGLKTFTHLPGLASSRDCVLLSRDHTPFFTVSPVPGSPPDTWQLISHHDECVHGFIPMGNKCPEMVMLPISEAGFLAVRIHS